MPKKPASEERDYLALAQLPVDHRSFIERVREAFLLEHGCVFDYQIAGVIERDKSRITQIFKEPHKIEAQTLHHVLEALESGAHRRLILQAWTKLCFGKDAELGTAGGLVGDAVTDKTIRRLDRMIRQNRLNKAAQTAQEAFEKAGDDILAMRALDRAYFALQRLDRPGSAMVVARRIAEHGLSLGDVRRVATGHFLRARILRGMGDSKISDILHILDAVEASLRIADPFPSPKPAQMLVTEVQVATERINTQVTFAERGNVEIDRETLREWLSLLTASAKASRMFQNRAKFLQLACRIHLLLGETFQAQELLEQSYESGGFKNLHAAEMSSVIQGRILVQTDSLETAGNYLREVVDNCGTTSDIYHQRLAEYDLARVEGAGFPTL